MEQRNNKQNSVIFQVEEILSKMSNQVSFLIRKDKLMNQLDVDVLMENTRKLYDTLCSVKCNMDVDSIPMEVVEGPKSPESSEVEEENENIEEESSEDFDEKDQASDGHESQQTNKPTSSDNNDSSEEDEEIEEDEKKKSQQTDDSISSDNDDFWNEDDDSIQLSDATTSDNDNIPDNKKNLNYQQTSVIISSDNDDFWNEDEEDDKVDDNDKDNEDNSTLHQTGDSGIRAYKKEHQTLNDILEHIEDNSLAARLQKKPVTDLMTAIGINDKFLLLNELFTGSMEKYNKSIRALNNFTTLLGALTYMSELQIEFQWDPNSEAYKKLKDLVERRFTPIHNS